MSKSVPPILPISNLLNEVQAAAILQVQASAHCKFGAQPGATKSRS